MAQFNYAPYPREDDRPYDPAEWTGSANPYPNYKENLRGAISRSEAISTYHGLRKEDFDDASLNPPASCGLQGNYYGQFKVWWHTGLSALRDRGVAKREREKQQKKDTRLQAQSEAKQAKLDAKACAKDPLLPARRRLDAAAAIEETTRRAWEAAFAEKTAAETAFVELQAAITATKNADAAAKKANAKAASADRKRKAETQSVPE
jgi:hypothetical protein